MRTPLLVVLAAMLGSVATAAAQEAPPQAAPEDTPEFDETVVVSATRSERRVEDEPLRVEVVPAEEVEEKIVMTPGDVSMLLAETSGGSGRSLSRGRRAAVQFLLSHTGRLRAG